MINSATVLRGFLPLVLLSATLAGCNSVAGTADNGNVAQSPSAWVEEQNRTFREQSDKMSEDMDRWSKSVSAPTPMPEPPTTQQIGAEIRASADSALDRSRTQLEQAATQAPAQAQPGFQRAQETLNEIRAKFRGP